MVPAPQDFASSTSNSSQFGLPLHCYCSMNSCRSKGYESPCVRSYDLLSGNYQLIGYLVQYPPHYAACFNVVFSTSQRSLAWVSACHFELGELLAQLGKESGKFCSTSLTDHAFHLSFSSDGSSQERLLLLQNEPIVVLAPLRYNWGSLCFAFCQLPCQFFLS